MNLVGYHHHHHQRLFRAFKRHRKYCKFFENYSMDSSAMSGVQSGSQYSHLPLELLVRGAVAKRTLLQSDLFVVVVMMNNE